MSHSEVTQDSRRLEPKLVLVLLVVIFLGPMFFAWATFQRSDQLQLNTVNHGNLVIPPRDAEALMLTDALSHQSMNESWYRGHWNIIYLLPKLCNQGCHENLYTLRQMHVALGKDAPRLKRALLFLPSQMPENIHGLLSESYPDVPQLIISEARFAEHLATLDDPIERVEVGTYYIVDPLGNLMMSYPGDIAAKAILTDFKRLLKVSTIG